MATIQVPRDHTPGGFVWHPRKRGLSSTVKCHIPGQFDRHWAVFLLPEGNVLFLFLLLLGHKSAMIGSLYLSTSRGLSNCPRIWHLMVSSAILIWLFDMYSNFVTDNLEVQEVHTNLLDCPMTSYSLTRKMKENIVKSPYSIVKCHQQYPNRQRIVMATLNRAWVHYNNFNL